MTSVQYTDTQSVPQDDTDEIENLCFLYIIGPSEEDDEGGPLKIGVSSNPFNRLKEIQTGNHRKQRIYYCQQYFTRAEALAAEKQSHECFEDAHIHGEWFQMYAWDLRQFLLENFIEKETGHHPIDIWRALDDLDEKRVSAA